MGFMEISAKLYSFPNCLYSCCLMWKELFAIKINKHYSQIRKKNGKSDHSIECITRIHEEDQSKLSVL